MLYDVSLRITQRYDRPAVGGRHVLRMTPTTLPDQQRIAASIDMTPRPDERVERTDFFGNSAIEVAFKAPHDRIDFTLRARVRRQASGVGLDLSPPVSSISNDVAEQRSLKPDAPHHYLPPSPRAPRFAEATAFARAAVAANVSAFHAVAAIGQAIHAAMIFDARATTVDTPVQEAFARRRGVCQDFSHLMISCLRGIGVPAGYVSGFLRTTPPPGQARLQGADSMHAWVRAWCGVEMGWVDYDPTNAVLVLDDHIALARGRDYSDVAPVRGVLRTAGGQMADHAVDMVAVEE
jgi:transglutaminase-like putative cysteine protease